MTSALSFCFFGILSVIVLSLNETLSPKFKGLILAGSGTVFFVLFFRLIKPVLETVNALSQKTGVPDLFQLVWKALGISFLVSLCASFCRDLGEEAVAGKLEMCGKGAILALSMPVLKSILELIGDFLT